MTSRNLYCSLLKESMKRRLWNIALIFLSFFFVLPVAMIYSMGEQRSFDTEVQWLEYKIRQASNLVSVNNGILVFVMITFAVICGISSFSFLHSRKKTDFYHSLPIRRETWFWVNFVSGVLMTALIYGLHLVIACAVAGINGVPMGELMQTAALGYAFHMVYFFLMYTVVVIAMMLTGNLVVAVLGISQFFVYGIFLLGMILNYFSIWFVTYFTRSGEGLTEWMYRLSPAAAYIHGMYVFEEEQRIAGTLLAPLAVTAVGIAVALWLYKKRPSEAAGKALAFSRTQSVIRCMIVVLCGMIGIWFFWQLRARTSWAVFGLLCGCVISHCTIEIIYHFDFRKLFSHKIQLAGCMVLTFLIFGCFRFDWFGYDTYVPDAGQVESIALRVDGDTDYDLYNVPEWMERSGGYYYWSSNPNQFIKEHMILTDVEPVLKIVQAGIDRNQRRQEELGETYYEERYGWTESEDEKFFNEVTVWYRMKNGKEVIRRYILPMNTVLAEMEQIHDQVQYKEGIYPILHETAETIRYGYFQDPWGESVRLQDGIGELLTAYQTDLRVLTLQERLETSPIGAIHFVNAQTDDAMSYNNATKDHYYGIEEGIDRTAGYPVYPSFANTIRVLEKLGIESEELGVKAEEVQEIQINTNERNPITLINAPEELEELAPLLISWEFALKNQWCETMSYMDIRVTKTDGTVRDFSIKEGTMPDWLLERLGPMKEGGTFEETAADAQVAVPVIED